MEATSRRCSLRYKSGETRCFASNPSHFSLRCRSWSRKGEPDVYWVGRTRLSTLHVDSVNNLFLATFVIRSSPSFVAGLGWDSLLLVHANENSYASIALWVASSYQRNAHHCWILCAHQVNLRGLDVHWRSDFKHDLIGIVLEDLPEEFNHIVASVNGRYDVISLDELGSRICQSYT